MLFKHLRIYQKIDKGHWYLTDLLITQLYFIKIIKNLKLIKKNNPLILNVTSLTSNYQLLYLKFGYLIRIF